MKVQNTSEVKYLALWSASLSIEVFEFFFFLCPSNNNTNDDLLMETVH